MIKKYTTFFDVYNDTDDHEEAIKSLKRALSEFNIEYIKTDGLRGYYTAKPYKKEWKPLNDERLAGWITGDWSDRPEGTSERDIDKVLKELKAKEVAVIYLPTSNIFSTAVDIYYK